ncbi:sensor domain-containing protein [Micromonospora lupini]|uniref:Two-component system histidine kinase n=1 Tax=Micromonospora lupini str. Lupac 08 TaxID=1150864 RepID=I0L6W7_9ACTN|nr:sensor domain-containing protein [Micromonospora lupini]CCH19564.1 Two-component system histidine kinase [Micromonospora lupini str. Lupac 08]
MAYVRGLIHASVGAVEHLVGGLGTAVLALAALLRALIVAATCLTGVGLLAAPGALRAVRSVADRERARPRCCATSTATSGSACCTRTGQSAGWSPFSPLNSVSGARSSC